MTDPAPHDDFGSALGLPWYVDQLAQRRDEALRDCAAAGTELTRLRDEHRRPGNTTSVAAQIVREESVRSARAVATAAWASYASALSSLYVATGGRYGQRLPDQPRPQWFTTADTAPEDAATNPAPPGKEPPA